MFPQGLSIAAAVVGLAILFFIIFIAKSNTMECKLYNKICIIVLSIYFRVWKYLFLNNRILIEFWPISEARMVISVREMGPLVYAVGAFTCVIMFWSFAVSISEIFCPDLGLFCKKSHDFKSPNIFVFPAVGCCTKAELFLPIFC